MKDKKITEEEDKIFEEEDNTVEITIRMKGQDVYRNYAWVIDGDWVNKGEIVEDMMESIENSYRHNF